MAAGINLTQDVKVYLGEIKEQLLYDLDKLYPEYEFAHHKGYPTKRHLELLRLYGPTSDYRFTYKPVRDLIEKGDVDEKTR